MKSMINPISLKSMVLFVLFAATTSLFGQAKPQIEARFANPSYDRESKTYFLDVELNSKLEPEFLFGMNLRFFYDPTKMDFIKVDQFSQGYGILGNPPVGIVGTEQSGIQLFGFSGAAAYINGALQNFDDRFKLQIPTADWVKVCRVSFKVPITTFNKENFCPSVIWDLEYAQDEGGFLPGSAGLVITVFENNRGARAETISTLETGQPFNWMYYTTGGLPHGEMVAAECMNVGSVVSTEEQDKILDKGYALFQNEPNPFDGRTKIEFILPYAQEATIILYDVDGTVKETIKGHYESGRNEIELNKKAWMQETSVIYYMLKTDKYTSKALSMSLVRA